MLCKLFKSFILWLLPITLIVMAGCGQSGPLYLPDQNEKNMERKN